MKKINRYLISSVLGLFLIVSYSRSTDLASPEASQKLSSTTSLNQAGTQCSQTRAGLVSWWPGEGNATDVIDGNDGLINGVSFVDGKVGSAFDFGGDPNNDVRITHNASIDFTTDNEYTIEFWIKTEPESTGHRALVEKWDGRLQIPFPYAVRLNTGDTDLDPGIGPIGTVYCASFDTDRYPHLQSDTRVDDNAFHHVACVFNHASKRMEIYIDGELENFVTLVVELGPTSNNIDLLLGIRDSIFPIQRPGTDFNGILDEVAMYSRALSGPEIADIFEAGSAGKCQFETIEVDINAGAINCNNENRIITIAIPTTESFDATTVDHATVRFGQNGIEAAETHIKKKTEAPVRHENDADGDGDIDLVFHFRFGETGIECGEENVRISGETFSGQAFEGFGVIRTVGN
jgi:hypothetical protein